jgi:hypothetical protein
MSSGTSTTGSGRGQADYSRMQQPGLGTPGMYQPGAPQMATGDTLGAPQGITGMYQPGAGGGAPPQMQPFGMPQTGMYPSGAPAGMAAPGMAQTGMYQQGMAQPVTLNSPQMRPFGLAQPAAAGMNGLYQTRPMGMLQQPQGMGGLAGQRQYSQGMNGRYGGY